MTLKILNRISTEVNEQREERAVLTDIVDIQNPETWEITVSGQTLSDGVYIPIETTSYQLGGGGSSSAYTLREISITNNTSGSVTVKNAVTETDENIYIASKLITTNNTAVSKLLSSKLQTNGYAEEYLEIRTLDDNDFTVTSDYAEKLGEFLFATGPNIYAKIVIVLIKSKSPQNISITLTAGE